MASLKMIFLHSSFLIYFVAVTRVRQKYHWVPLLEEGEDWTVKTNIVRLLGHANDKITTWQGLKTTWNNSVGNAFYTLCRSLLFWPMRLTQCCTQFKPFGNKTLCFRIFHIIKCEYHIVMQIQYTNNLNPGRFELGTTLS